MSYKLRPFRGGAIDNKGRNVMLENGKSVSVKKVKILRYAGGYVQSTLERNAGKSGII